MTTDGDSATDWRALADGLQRALGTDVPPIAISFRAEADTGAERFDAPMPPPTPDGRTGRVPAGCVFWMHATVRTFATLPEDHGNCSVGMVTHGLATLDEVAGNADVAELLACGRVTPDAVQAIPAVRERPAAIVYGPPPMSGPPPTWCCSASRAAS